MAKIPCGTTWWGKRWLEALSGLDFENRLPRGRSYFQNGRVLSESFDQETRTFEARVQGSRLTPYRVRIRFPELDRKSTGELADAIAGDHECISMLLDRRLPEKISEIAANLGIDLFPRSWRDFELSCTCPDFAVPCKHMAAVYFALVRAIDADPMNIFRFRGADLPAELEKRGVKLSGARQFRLADLQSLLAWKSADALQQTAPEKDGERESPSGIAAFAEMPLYRVPDLSQALMRLLPEKTGLFPDGRAWISRTAGRIRKKAAAALRTRGVHLGEWKALEAGPLGSAGGFVPQIRMFDGRLDFCRPSQSGNAPRPLSEKRASGWFFDALLSVSHGEAREHSLGLAVWWELVSAALTFMKNGATVPVLLRQETEKGAVCTVVWEPAVASEAVRTAVLKAAAAAESCAVPLLVLPDDVDSTPEGRMFAVLTVLITALSDYLQAADEPQRSRLVTGLFLDRYRCLEEETCAAEIASLSQYLRPLSLYQLPTVWQPAAVVRSFARDSLRVNLGAVKSSEPDGKPVMLKTFLTDEAYEKDRYAVVSMLQMMASVCPELASVVASGGKSEPLPAEQLKSFLFESRPALELLGARVLLPRRLRKMLRPKLRANISGAQESAAGRFFSKEMLSEFSWSVTVGNREFSAAEAADLFSRKGAIVRIDDDYVWLDPEEISRMEKRLAAKKPPSYLERVRGVLTGEMDGAEVSVSENILKEIRSLSREEALQPPEGLQAELRPYQERGFSWLVRNFRLGLGSLIADDMGLGKTLQVIAAILQLKNDGELEKGRVLIAVPATLITNWVREIRRFAPSLSAAVYHGAERRAAGENRPDILITTYGTLRRDLEMLSALKWKLLVLDEAQAMKNVTTGVYAAAASFPAERVIAMTGTPVENRLMEYWSVFSIVQPGLLGSAPDFRAQFAVPIEGEHEPAAAEALRKLVAPFMLRRLKTDRSIIRDLPDRLVQDVMTGLLPEQVRLYEEALSRNLTAIGKAEEHSETGRPQRRALVLRLITELKQICNSPSQYSKTWSDTPDSAKGEALLERLDECRENGRKVIIFTQYREMGERLQAWIERRTGRKPEFLHGGTGVARRAAMVDDFQNNPDSRVLLVSLKAGGTGLNLTAASVVIHYDLWWNPAVESQASDRAWRIGQQRDVLILRFVTEGTFEERINEMLTHKRRVADLAVKSGEAWIGDMSETELRELFKIAEN